MMNESEVFDPTPEALPPPQLEWGTVGWVGSKEVTELGKEAGDGVTLVRVTLYKGHETGRPKSDDGLANGQRILAQPLGPSWRVPKRGERVLVGFPGGGYETPGNAVILGVAGTSPSSAFGRKKTVLDYGDDDLVIRSKSITLEVESESKETGLTSRYTVSLSGDGGLQVVADGCGVFIKDGDVNIKAIDADGNLKTCLIVAQDELSALDFASGSPATLTLKGGNVSMVGNFVSIGFSTSLSLGLGASPASPVVVGPSGVTGIGSSRIFATI